MKNKIPGILEFMVACMAFLILSSCNNSIRGDANEIEVLTLKGPSAMSMLFMMNELEQINEVPVKFKILNEPLQVRALMLKEDPEFALLPTNMAANLYNKGVPYQLAAIPVWGTLMLFGNDNSIKNWSDLKGKRVHLMAKGMTPDILFRFLAVKNGINPDEDLILDYSFPSHSDLANAVIAGLADIAVLSEPLVSMVRSKNKQVGEIFNLDEEWKKVFSADFSIPQTSLVVRSDFASDNPDLVEVFIEKYQKYCSKITEEKEHASKLAVDFNILPDVSTAFNAIPGCNMDVQPSWYVKDRVKAFLEVFYNFNPESIGGQMPDENFFFEK